MKVENIKIVHISTSATGGAGTAAYRIHEALVKDNINSHFLSLDEKLPNEFIKCFSLNKSIILFKKFPLLFIIYEKIIWRYKYHFRVFKTKQEKIKMELSKIYPQIKCDYVSLPFSEYNILNNSLVKKADIIHLHWTAGMLDYPSFFKKNKKTIVWTLHDMNPFQGIFHYKEDENTNKHLTHNLDEKILKLKQNCIINSLAQISIVSPSKWLLNNSKNSEIFSSLKNQCIHNPLNVDLFCPSETSQLKILLKIPEENTIFLFVAENVNNKRKGFDLLIDALKSFEDQKITLLVIGNLQNRIEINLDIKILGSIKNVTLMQQYYSIADAFILPSREDNLPNVMLESMACGTPVLAFNIGGMADIIIDGFNGLKAYNMEPAGLINIIDRFIKTKKQFVKKDIQNFANENFSNKKISSRYIELYNSLISKK